MLTHEQIWRAIDRLATSFGYSPSGLAKQAGLDPTSFNKSKRIGPDGKPRWPSTESISRILAATGATMSDFISLVDDIDRQNRKSGLLIPVIGFAQAGAKGYFDEDGYPQGDSWDEVRFPEFNASDDDEIYALEISGDSMEPLYRKGDVLVLSPKAKIRNGDRVVIKTTKGEVMAKELAKQSAAKIEIKSLNPDHENRKIPANDIAWMARIIWVSQ
ncbi:MAG TPA: helix-turn-helix transcriptional regulator [Alphaproteobacteria bacterium]|nr:helix-turn-helix transcriptional regulator [Alphaproteobacteria bacterium]